VCNHQDEDSDLTSQHLAGMPTWPDYNENCNFVEKVESQLVGWLVGRSVSWSVASWMSKSECVSPGKQDGRPKWGEKENY
jgi:hypothetical protein